MLSQKAKETAYLKALVDALLLCTAFGAAFMIRSHVPLPFLEPPSLLSFSSHFWLLVIAVPLHWALTTKSRTDPTYARRAPLAILRGEALPFIYLGLLLATAIFLFQAKSFSRAVFFLFIALGFLLVVAERLFVKAGSRRAGPSPDRNVLIVGLNHEALLIRGKIESRPEYHLRVVGHVSGPGETESDPRCAPVLGRVEDLRHIVEDQVVDDVFFVVSPSDLPSCEQQIAWCEEVGVSAHLKVDLVRTLLARTYANEFDGIPILTLASTPHDALAVLAKRAIDIVGCATMLILLSPLMLLAAAAIRLSSAGPAIFSQKRVGLNGRSFKLHKFRSMYIDAEARRASLSELNEISGPVFKMKHDPRITPVGRWLRKFSVDELPQLWNVLRGEMSLVGPRPALASEVKQYHRWQRRRLSIKPGITCLWQVNGRSKIPFEDWMKLDLEYIDNWSLKLDLKILLRTVPAVVFARGAK